MHTELEGHVLLKWEKVDFRAHGDALWVSMEDLQWQEIMEKWVTSYQTQGKLESIIHQTQGKLESNKHLNSPERASNSIHA